MPPGTGRRLPSRGLSATTPPPEDEDESLSMPPSEPFVDPLDEEGPLRLPDPVPGVAPVKVVEHDAVVAAPPRPRPARSPRSRSRSVRAWSSAASARPWPPRTPRAARSSTPSSPSCFAAAVILASSVARRWTWLVLSGTAVVLAAPLPARLLAIVALLVAFHGAAIATKRSRISGAVVAALSMQGLLRAAAHRLPRQHGAASSPPSPSPSSCRATGRASAARASAPASG